MVSQRPRRQYMVLQWGQVDLQEYANCNFVSNNNIFTIPFLNTYYHKQMNNILIAAYNETFRQSSDPVYAHTPMRNDGELRTFNPKLKDSAGGEVNHKFVHTVTHRPLKLLSPNLHLSFFQVRENTITACWGKWCYESAISL